MSKPKFKIVVGRGRPVTKLALLAVIVLSTLTLLAIDGAADREREKAEAARAQAAAEERAQQELEQKIDALGSDQSMEQIAGEELGLVDPDTIIIEEDGEN